MTLPALLATVKAILINTGFNGKLQTQEIPPTGALYDLYASSLAGQLEGSLSQTVSSQQFAPAHIVY